MIKLLWAMLGTLGFGIIFNVNKDKLLPVMIGGFLNYLAYYITFKLIFIISIVCCYNFFIFGTFSFVFKMSNNHFYTNRINSISSRKQFVLYDAKPCIK